MEKQNHQASDLHIMRSWIQGQINMQLFLATKIWVVGAEIITHRDRTKIWLKLNRVKNLSVDMVCYHTHTHTLYVVMVSCNS